MKRFSRGFLSLIMIMFIACSVFFVDNKNATTVIASGNNTVTFDYNISRIKNYVSEDRYSELSKPYFTTAKEGFASDKQSAIDAIKGLRDYYTFNWVVNGTNVTIDKVSSYPITSNTIFVGNWTPVNYQITY